MSDDGRRRAGRWQFDEEPLNLGDVVDAVIAYAADSREAALVIEDLLSTGRIRLTRRGADVRGGGLWVEG